MEYNFPVSITEASYCNSPIVMYIHLSATAVLPYISSYSIHMVGVTDKFNFFYFYIFYFKSECGKIILYKYKFLSYVLSQKHNTMNLLFMLFFYFFFHPHIYYRASHVYSSFCHSSSALYQLLFHIHGRCHR